MSAQEIIAELARLHPDELRLVRERLSELDAATAPEAPLHEDSFLQVVQKTARVRPDWPDDFALNHGYYVSGEPKKS